jgi:hypothetical protein
MTRFENDVAIQKAMRHFSSADLAKVVLHAQETGDAFKRNMMEASWRPIQEFLDDREFCETPEEAYERFAERYEEYANKEEGKCQ